MGEIGDAVSYTVLALGFVLLIFVGALFFVQSSRGGNRRFKWGRRAARAKSSAEQRSASARDS